jgi:hypothetical protein
MYLFEIILRRLSRQKDDGQLQATVWVGSGRTVAVCCIVCERSSLQGVAPPIAERMFFMVLVYTVMVISA